MIPAGGDPAPVLSGRPVLVTGATGFIGSHLAERLLRAGARVRAAVRRPERALQLRSAGAEIRTIDLTAPGTLTGCCDGVEVVFHCAAWLGSPYTREAAYATNVAGTRALAAEALRAGVARFVHLSSIAVYGPVRAGTVTEESPLWRGVELYGDSKIGAEEALGEVAAQGLASVIARPGMVYGPRSRGWTIRLVQWIDRGRPAMVADGGGYARPIFIENLVDALILCAVRPVAGEAFTLIDTNMRWRDYLDRYARMVGKRARAVSPLTSWLIAVADETRSLFTRRPPRVRRTALGYAVSQATFSTEKARRLLGWSPRYSMDEAMEITRTWLTENGYLKPAAGKRP
ncbi:MAG: NAD-dependent epimerase/dehydratase family protein [Armatimonadota bacterium]|nr:NAD-dependent epimerase/dehydratase family protein [Armatimonadota bacterium]MDR7451090.1 NAD-dependent epimerase/dehydratase family protein [Armatimonadota bacterium]MDR7465889.1 NAD-dependent epimerase/dehydratase family protein [Armatimonadota bacterium]MDR7493954.1 NAD-dependent epimerase/dehydratase family protein [Armatimonadota bacterium]MDR7498404.1 NAD-dependent epimerase/dehydratase family protein [Armatimonadota bacterium]